MRFLEETLLSCFIVFIGEIYGDFMSLYKKQECN